MMRKGVSFTLVIIVSALVMVTAAVMLSISSQGVLNQLNRFLKGGTPDKAQEIRSYCLERKLTACRSVPENEDQGVWAKNVEVEGRTCWEWADEDKVFGSGGTDDIPPC